MTHLGDKAGMSIWFFSAILKCLRNIFLLPYSTEFYYNLTVWQKLQSIWLLAIGVEVNSGHPEYHFPPFSGEGIFSLGLARYAKKHKPTFLKTIKAVWCCQRSCSSNTSNTVTSIPKEPCRKIDYSTVQNFSDICVNGSRNPTVKKTETDCSVSSKIPEKSCSSVYPSLFCVPLSLVATYTHQHIYVCSLNNFFMNGKPY